MFLCAACTGVGTAHADTSTFQAHTLVTDVWSLIGYRPQLAAALSTLFMVYIFSEVVNPGPGESGEEKTVYGLDGILRGNELGPLLCATRVTLRAKRSQPAGQWTRVMCSLERPLHGVQ